MKILDGGNLGQLNVWQQISQFVPVNWGSGAYERLSTPWQDMVICSRCAERSDMIRIDRFVYCYAGGQQPEVPVSKGLVDGGDGDEPGAMHGC